MTTNKYIKKLTALALLTGVTLSMTACNNAGEGALSGAGLGALGGLAIGSVTGSAGRGAAIGAVAGGVSGAVIGDQNQRNRNNGNSTTNW
jgi:osmotically inducible lipoprotein OsmB